MANQEECAICKRMTREKHKHDKFYKIGFWVLLILLVVALILLFSRGNITSTKTTKINNNEDINVYNDGSNNTTSIGWDNGSNTIS